MLEENLHLRNELSWVLYVRMNHFGHHMSAAIFGAFSLQLIIMLLRSSKSFLFCYPQCDLLDFCVFGESGTPRCENVVLLGIELSPKLNLGD